MNACLKRQRFISTLKGQGAKQKNKQFRMKKHLRFTKKKTSSPLPKSNPSVQKDIPLSKWYQSIYELPLFRFEDCFINNNLSALVISGYPLPETLSDTWTGILQEYADAMGNSEHQMYINLMREVEILRMDVECIKVLVSTLRLVYSKYFCEQLQEMTNTTCKFDWNDQDNFQKEVDKCERRAKSFKINYDLKKSEFENVRKKIEAKSDKKIDKNYFTGVLIMLSRHNNYRITKDITVNEYCEYIRQFNNYCENLGKASK